ncbi:YtxH domain-containing protein [Rhodopseudomonas palustris]|uniref:YtxH domain-containing protein n=1 Tax=Rhodopseudomonas palustris TaxID=1076 RepID=UPI000E5A9CF7|nr:YtxH domain-containing protein [Rhodopseudomonas palustris]QLH71361.1 YtxH domain-containing protein [Rhodopseudomonas palustris]RIA03595.1 YtxH domain-containing protein [Rhodopseudomonas palustris]
MAKKKGKRGKGLKRREIEQLLAGQLTLAGNNQRQGMLGNLGGLLPKGRNEQFLLGLLIGGLAAYVLSEEELRSKLFKGAIKAYANMMGSVAELKEQFADLSAEVEAEQSGTV